MPKAAKPSSRKKRSTRGSSTRSAGRSPSRAKSGGGSAASRRRKPQLGNYSEALTWLHERVNIERVRPSRIDKSVFKLDRMRKLAEALDSPQDELRFVQVAGTNGKGSIVAMLASCLEECGCAVGAFTSPHLIDVRERVSINGQMISHHRFVDIMNRIARAAQSLPSRLGEPTFFEVLTAMALVHFAEQAIDLAILEVGMGGRLDSTSIVTPDIAAVGAIALDHTAILGDTLEQIAREKAGIFKSDSVALTFGQDKKVLAAMREVAQSAGTVLEVVGDDIEFSYRFEANPQLGPHMRVGLSTPRATYQHVPVPLPGEHQARNCGLVLAILDKLADRGLDVPESKVILGLENTRAPGRMERAWARPRVYLDGAHNPAALGALVRSLGAHVSYDSLIMIFGCSADKDVDGMLAQLATGADKVIFTRSRSNPRAAEPESLARRFVEASSKMCQTSKNLDEALSTAARASGRDDLVCVTGSFYLAGEAKKLLADKAQRAAV